MRKTLLMIVLVSLLALPVSAQQSQSDPLITDTAVAHMRRGRTITWIGISMIGVGAVIIPATATRGTREEQSSGAVITGVSLIGGGAGMLLWGAKEKKNATPHTTFGIAVGRTNGFMLRREW